MTTHNVVWHDASGGALVMSGWPNKLLVADMAVNCLKEHPEMFPRRSYLCPLTDDAFCVVPGDMERATAAAVWAAQWVLAGKRVAVVCREGLNRSGLVAALAVRQLGSWPCAALRMTGEDALHYVQVRREGALYNWHFQEALRQLD